MPDGAWYQNQAMYQVRDQLMVGRLQWNHRQFLKDLPAKEGSLLDVGCGTGEFLSAAQAAGYRTSGFDFDPGAIETAKKKYGLSDLLAGNLLEYRNRLNGQGGFDVVTAFEVLEHSPKPGEFIQTLTDMVRPGGFLAVSVPNRNRWPRFRYSWDLPPNHLTRWSRESLTCLLEKNGFQIIRTETGWRQGEPFLHQHLQFGMISRLIRKQEDLPQGGSSSHKTDVSLSLAHRAFRLKETTIQCLAIPINLGLWLMGETGMTLYVVAQRDQNKKEKRNGS